jgi:hypothetical protein
MFEIVGRAVVINLPSRADRRRQMQAQLDSVGATNYQWFSAIRPLSPEGFETIGARGCFLSHLQVLRDAVGLPSIVIIEDDLDFTPAASANFARAIASLPADWGMFYGSHFTDVSTKGGYAAELPASEPLMTAAFFAVNGHVIPPLVDYLSRILARPPGHPDGGPMHVDGAYSRFREGTGCRTFVSVPCLGWQRPSHTDIHEAPWYESVPVLRGATMAMKRLKRLLLGNRWVH